MIFEYEVRLRRANTIHYTSFHKYFDEMFKFYMCTGCPKKNALFHLTGHRGHQEWTRDKSRVSFEKFRKFPFWWAQKLLIFVRKCLRKMRSKTPTPLEKRHDCESSWRYFPLLQSQRQDWLIISFWKYNVLWIPWW